jgi:hypothetical protein
MSKPIVRVTLFVLISLVLIAATSFSVRALLDDRQAAGVQSHAVDGLRTNLNHDRSATSELESLQMQSQPGNGHEGGCNSESQTSSNDY